MGHTIFKQNHELFYARYYTAQNEKQIQLLERLESLLPHGSGIDGNWDMMYLTRRNIIHASNYYHAMDEYGGYCHSYDFTIRYKYNGKDKNKPCHICMNEFNSIPSYRSFDDFKRFNWTIEQWIEYPKVSLYGGYYIKCTACNNGIVDIPEFEYLSLNFRGQHEYSCCGYDLKNYLADTINESVSYNLQTLRKIESH